MVIDVLYEFVGVVLVVGVVDCVTGSVIIITVACWCGWMCETKFGCE